MQIALTKKLADAIGIKPVPANEEVNPLFSWTANWITTWDNRRTEDMLVLVNQDNRFAVAIYQVKRKDLKHVAKIIQEAISNTLLALNINPEVVEKYLEQAGDITFVRNANRTHTAWVNHAGQESAFHVGRFYNGMDKMFNDTLGASISDRPVKDPKSKKEVIFPAEEMVQALAHFTKKPPYNYRAFELLVTLDLMDYQATRRLIVPADINFFRLHHVLQEVFGWTHSHLYDFTFFNQEIADPDVRLVPFAENLEYDATAILMDKQPLSDYLQEDKHLIYTYDMGDNWQHKIELVDVLENYTEESPYLLEASGQTPPEDVGGVWGFADLRQIMQDPNHPEHLEMKEWAGYWRPELWEWEERPRVIRV